MKVIGRIEKRRQLKFDELNDLGREFTELEEEWDSLSEEDQEKRVEIFHDCLIDFYIDGFASGVLQMEDELPEGYEFLDIMPDPYEALNITYSDGMTPTDKFREYMASKDSTKLQVLIEAEANRMWNTASYDFGKDKATTKTWHTMKDNRVRNTHDYIDEVEMPFDEKFVTFDGDSAYAPGMFEKPENNVNCRCWITMK